MNSVILVGRLVADPELKTTQSGLEVTSFRIAVGRSYSKDSEKKADFIDVVAWRKTAAFICQYFEKGKPIAIRGSLQTRSYDAKDGSKRYVTEVLADNVEFVPGSKSGGNTASQGYSQAYSVPAEQPSYAAPPTMDNLFDNDNSKVIDVDDDLPF